jgi:hypothetical protein
MTSNALFRSFSLAVALASWLVACTHAAPHSERLVDTGSLEQAATTCEVKHTPTTASASSTESSSYPASKAIDGNTTSRWSSAFSDPQWLKLDLGSEKPVSRVVLRWENAASSSYDLQVSSDGTSWSTVRSNAEATISGQGSSRIDTLSGFYATARYVRVYSRARTTSYGNSLWEVEIYGDTCRVSCASAKLSLAAATASSVESSSTPASKAVDGSTTTRWSSAFSDPQWLTVDLGKETNIERVVLDWEKASSSNYEIQVSSTGGDGTWQTVRKVASSQCVDHRIDDLGSLGAVGRYVRMYSYGRSTAYGNSLWELSVYGNTCLSTCVAVEQGRIAASASSTENSGTPASYAIDGNLATRWSSVFSDPQWLTIDLGTVKSVDRLLLDWESASSSNYEIQVSADASGPWQSLRQVQSSASVNHRVDDVRGLAGSGRYVRIYSRNRTSQWGNSLWETRVFGCAEGEQATSPTCHPYITRTDAGDLVFSVTLPTRRAYVEAFVRRNGIQEIAQNIVDSARQQPDNSVEYSFVLPASRFKVGDLIETRFYSYESGGPGVFTPGPEEMVWAAPFTYRSDSTCTPPDDDVDGDDGETNERVGACDDQSCCPSDSTPVLLTNGQDLLSTAAPKVCVVALDGGDQVVCSGTECTVLGGGGGDHLTAGAGALLRGGDGADFLQITGGGTIYGNDGADAINLVGAGGFVYPGGGADAVTGGAGDDTVVVYDLCEIASGELLDGGAGNDTLITPVAVEELTRLGVTVRNFETIEVRQNSCNSDCTTKPDCSDNGVCGEGDVSGEVQCDCLPGFYSEKCDEVCASPLDSDDDGTLDCFDLCKFDANKLEPGDCGCGLADVHSDNDGVADCDDLCPSDPQHLVPGECGCKGDTSRIGQPCSVPACPGEANPVCNADNVCGQPSLCQPHPDCRFVETRSSNYWICAEGERDGVNFRTALENCSAHNLELARVDTGAENERLGALLGADAWLGGNSLIDASQWYWSWGSSYDGAPFWNGQGAVGGRFEAWEEGEPSGDRCLTMHPLTKGWSADDCIAPRAYVCEYLPPESYGTMLRLPLPQSATDDTGVCTPGSVYNEDQLKDQEEKAGTNEAWGEAIATPEEMAGQTCPDLVKTNSCRLVVLDANFACNEDEECAAHGADAVCRTVYGTDCETRWDANGVKRTICDTANRCGKLDCCDKDDSCPTWDDECREKACPANNVPCVREEVCENAGSTFTTELNPDSSVAEPTPVDAETFFGAPRDEAQSGEYSDPSAFTPCADQNVPDVPLGCVNDSTKALLKHPWCKMKPQATGKLQPAVAEAAKHGDSGKGSPVKLDFDPNLDFEANPRPLALGETNVMMKARGSLDATVELKGFLGVDTGPTSLLHAEAGILAERCRVSTIASKFEVLGVDLVEPSGYDFDTNDSKRFGDLGRRCSSALSKFQEAADRAKKAFRDATQLLEQYKELEELAKTDLNTVVFGSDLCDRLELAGKVIPGFPGGNVCPEGEPAELTINRFVWYFQFGQGNSIDGVSQAAKLLADVTSELKQKLTTLVGGTGLRFEKKFGLAPMSETMLIASVQFVIGFVPVTLELEAVSSYGVDGALEFALQLPTDLGEDRAEGTDIASAKVSFLPRAAAGLILFAGAGSRFANVGLEGKISLASISAPVYAGAALKVSTVRDTRPLDEIEPLALAAGAVQDVFPFGPGVSYRFYLEHYYGAKIKVEDVLSGKLSARLRIKFGWFSRTWRKKIYEFNGWRNDFTLLEGGGQLDLLRFGASSPGRQEPASLSYDSEETPMGISEAQLPLVYLDPLKVPDAEPLSEGADFDRNEVGKLFYEAQCCSEKGNGCGSVDTPGCCAGLACIEAYSGAQPKCLECAPANTDCSDDVPCCDGLECNGYSGKCEVPGGCRVEDEPCTGSNDCCGDLFCDGSGHCDQGGT